MEKKNKNKLGVKVGDIIEYRDRALCGPKDPYYISRDERELYNSKVIKIGDSGVWIKLNNGIKDWVIYHRITRIIHSE
jgi:hypothetical protein